MTERTPLVLIGGVKKQLPVGDTLAKSIVGLDRADNTPDLEKPVSQPTQDALAKKADLDSGGKVPAAQLPSYVDDVLEYNTFANLPNTGEAGKIYVTLDPYTDSQGRTSSQFRWTGSAYTPIIASPGTTDAVTEGTTNLYFTTNRVRQILLTGLSVAVGGVIAATDSLMDALGKLQYQISNLNKGSVGLGQVDNTSDLSKPVSTATAIALGDTGGQNMAYNSAFLKVSASAANLADGWEFDGPGNPGNSTGVLSLVASFLTPAENAQRIAVTNLTTSAYYRSLVNTIARASKASPGQTVVASVRIKGTAGLQMRIFLQAINSGGSAIAAPASAFFPLTGDVQNLSFAYPNLPANTVGVRSFYRIYAGASVTDGSVDLARPKLEFGSYATGWSEDNIVIREDVASKARSLNGTFTGDTMKIDVASTAIGAATGGNAGLELGSTVVGTATTPFIDFHSGSNPVDYDCRLLASGGNGTSGNGALTFAGIAMYMSTDLYVNRQNKDSKFSLNSNAGYNRYTRYTSGDIARWDFGVSNAAESGSNAGSDLYVYNFNDTGNYMSTPWGITRSTGETKMTRAAVSGPFKVGQYTLATLPAASAYEGYDIDVTDAAGGPKRCRSNRTNWLILNTTTPVS